MGESGLGQGVGGQQDDRLVSALTASLCLPREMTRRGRLGAGCLWGKDRARQCSAAGSTAHVFHSSAAQRGGVRDRRKNDTGCRNGGGELQ